MDPTYDETVHDFDLNFLSDSKALTINERNRKTRRQVSLVKAKIAATDEMIRTYLRQKEEATKTEFEAKQELQNTYIKLKDANDECTKLENENKIHKAKAIEYKKQADHFEDQYNALKSHANQLQLLVKELETQIEGISLEKQLEASNVKETDSKILSLQKDNEVMLKDILTLKEVVLGRKKVGKNHVILLRKYKRDKKKQDICISDESNNETDDFDDPPMSPLLVQTNSDIFNRGHNKADKIVPNYAQEERQKQKYNDQDSDYSHDVASVDTGRGSSRTNSYDKCLSSPDYFIPVPMSERADIINKEQARCIDVANSPITVQEFISVATSPIMFNENTSISVATSPVIFHEFSSISVATSPVIFHEFSSISVATSPIMFDNCINSQEQKHLSLAEYINDNDSSMYMEVVTIIEEENNLVDACTDPISSSSDPDALIYTGTSPTKHDGRTIDNRNHPNTSASLSLLLDQNEVSQSDLNLTGRESENKLLGNTSENIVPTIDDESLQNNIEVPVTTALEKECLEEHNSHKLCNENSNDHEIEHIFKIMKLNYDLITPIPKTPILKAPTSKTLPMTLISKTPPTTPISKISTSKTPPITTNSSDTERIINLEIKSAYYEEKFTKVFADLEMLKKAMKVRNKGKIRKRDNWGKNIGKTHAEVINNDSHSNKKDKSAEVLLVKELEDIEEERNLHTEQSTDNIELNEVCKGDIKHTRSNETTTNHVIENNAEKRNMHLTTKSNIIKKRKISKLEKLRQKMKPTSKIKRAPSPIPKRITKVKVSPIAMDTDLLTLKNKAAFENAVKVMTEIKSKQIQNENTEVKSTSKNNQHISGREAESVKLDCPLNNLDIPMHVSQIEENSPSNNKDRSLVTVSKFTQNESLRDISVPASKIDHNAAVSVEESPVPVNKINLNINKVIKNKDVQPESVDKINNNESLRDISIPANKIYYNASVSLEESPVPDNKINPNKIIRTKNVQPESVIKINKNESLRDISVPASKIDHNAAVSLKESPAPVNKINLNLNKIIRNKGVHPESVDKINKNELLQNTPVPSICFNKINQNTKDLPSVPVSKTDQNETLRDISSVLGKNMNPNALLNNIESPVSISKTNQNAPVKEVLEPMSVRIINDSAPLNDVRVPFSSMHKKDEINEPLKGNVDTQLSPISKIEEIALLDSNIRFTRSLTRRLSKRDEDFRLSLSPQKIIKLDDGLSSPEKHPDNRRVRKRHSDFAEENLVESAKRVLRRSYDSKVVSENSSLLSQNENIVNFSQEIPDKVTKQIAIECETEQAVEILSEGTTLSNLDKPTNDFGNATMLSKTIQASEKLLNEQRQTMDVVNTYVIQSNSRTMEARNENISARTAAEVREKNITKTWNPENTFQDNQITKIITCIKQTALKTNIGVADFQKSEYLKGETNNKSLKNTITTVDSCAPNSLQGDQSVNLSNGFDQDKEHDADLVKTSKMAQSVPELLGSQLNQKDYLKSPGRQDRDNANNLQKQFVVEHVPLKADQIESVQHTVIDYGDLNLYTDETEQVGLLSTTKKDLRHLRENILCTALDKYAVITVKYTAKKIPDGIKNSIAKIIEENIVQIISQPKDKQKSAMQDLFKNLQNYSTKHILSGLMVYLKDPERKLELFSKATTVSAPHMTKAEIILIYVIEQLNNASSGDFVQRVWNNIEHTLFQLGRTPHFDVIESLSHFYAVMCRYFRNKSRLRCFMLDAMYCLQFKAIPLIRQCLDVCPSVLPQAHERLARSPLVTCLVYLLHFYKCQDRFNRAQAIRNLLQGKYSYSFTEWTEAMILEIFTRAIMSTRDTVDRKMLRLALIVLCKRNGPKWCEVNIIKNMLMPIIEKPHVQEQIRAFCVSMLGPLLKPFPADRKAQCEVVTNQLHRFLEGKPSHVMQEAIYSSLIYMSKHGQDRVVQALLSWNPRHISKEFEEVLNDYVMEKPLKVWKNLLTKKAVRSEI